MTAEAPELVNALSGLDLRVRGLMTVAPPAPEEAARAFRVVGELADSLGLPERSMGMSDDLERAVAAGSTMVRIGRALFGPRSREPGGLVQPAPLGRHYAGPGTGEGMAPSFMKKTMVYLGLLDDEYDEYDNLEDRAPRGFSSTTRVDSGRQEVEQPDEYAGGMSRIRTIPRESAVPNVRPQPRHLPRLPAPPRCGPCRWTRPSRAPRRPGSTWWRRPGSATPKRSPTG